MNNPPLWSIPSGLLTLNRDEIHVWRACVDVDAERGQDLERFLGQDEVARAERFRRSEDRSRYIASHGVLRSILGMYTGVPVDRLAFQTSTAGKPTLMDQSEGRDIRFSISHSHMMSLYAVSNGRDIGVDLERLRADLDMMGIAGCCFSKEEFEALENISPQQLQEGFFRAWTRKEAYLKATGEGIGDEMQMVDVISQWGEIVDRRSKSETVNRHWRGLDVDPAEGYVGALVAEGVDSRYTFWQYVV